MRQLCSGDTKHTAGLSGKPNQAGVFEVKDWVNTTRQIWPFEAKDGRAPFQRAAMGYDSDITRATQSLDNITDTQLSDIVTERIQSISSIIADKEAEKFALQRALDASAGREGVRVSTSQARATLVAGDPSASRIAGLETEIALMKQQLEQVKNVFAKSNASVVEKSLMAYALSLGTNVLGGVLVAGGAASRPGQNFLAGQTGWQAWVQRQLREGANVRQRQATRDAGVLGFDSSLIGQAGGEPITESNMNAILKASLPVKRQYYNRLEARGQLQRVRAFYPQQLKQLEEDISPN
jgi:xanthine dehydrogenase iron-sulfur cluster and FAD-binding subunit A